MKRTFSREYWFLTGCWAVFSVLGLVASVWGNTALSSDALGRFTDPSTASVGIQTVLSILASSCTALSGAALGIIAIRYWIKPYLVAWLLVLLWQAGTIWPVYIQNGEIGLMGLSALSLVLSCAVMFGIAKGLYLLLKGREWAVVVLTVLLGTVSTAIRILVNTAHIPAYVEMNMASSWLNLLKDTLLSAASYFLLYVCIRKWWEKGPEAVAEVLEEAKEEHEEEIFEEELEEEREKP